MHQTVVIDEKERDRRFENRLNAVARHCRIGKVTPKVWESALLPGRMFPPLVGIASPARDWPAPSDWFQFNPNTSAAQ